MAVVVNTGMSNVGQQQQRDFIKQNIVQGVLCKHTCFNIHIFFTFQNKIQLFSFIIIFFKTLIAYNIFLNSFYIYFFVSLAPLSSTKGLQKRQSCKVVMLVNKVTKCIIFFFSFVYLSVHPLSSPCLYRQESVIAHCLSKTCSQCLWGKQLCP